MIISVDLETIPFFKHIPKDLIKKIAEKFKVKDFKKGEIIITYGSPVDSIYLIVQGSVDIFTADKEEKIASLGFGAAIGEASLFISQKSATANVIASDDGTSLLVMPKSILESEILTNDNLAASFYKGMCAVMAERLNVTNRVVANKIADLKQKLRTLLDDNELLKKFKNTQQSIEILGSDIFSALADISKLLEKNAELNDSTLDIIQKAKKSVEQILLKDLQNIDRIAQKLGYAIQYLENIERTLNNQELSAIRGDKRLFVDDTK